MKLLTFRLWLLGTAVFSVVVFSGTAFAQTGPNPPPVNAPIVVTFLVSLLLGVLNSAIQTGKILTQWAFPAAWSPYFLMGATFLGGVSSYIGSLNPFVLNGSTIFYMVAAGMTMLVTGLTPGVMVHHLGGKVNEKRPAALPAPEAVSTTPASK
jgi:hypothetical protein